MKIRLNSLDEINEAMTKQGSIRKFFQVNLQDYEWYFDTESQSVKVVNK